MSWNELIDTMRRASADAGTADRLYRDRDFLAELRTSPELALRPFELAAPVAPRPTAVRQVTRTTWRIGLEARRARPIL